MGPFPTLKDQSTAHRLLFAVAPEVDSEVRWGSFLGRSRLLRRVLVAIVRGLMIVSAVAVAANIVVVAVAVGVEALEPVLQVLVEELVGEVVPVLAAAAVAVASMALRIAAGGHTTDSEVHSKVGREVKAGSVEVVRGCRALEMMVVEAEKAERRSSRFVELEGLTTVTCCFLRSNNSRFQHRKQSKLAPVERNPVAVAMNTVG